MYDVMARSPTSRYVAPGDLIQDYCHPQDVGRLADPVEIEGARVWQGFCGFGGAPRDSFVVDFIDGSEFAYYLMARGWSPPFRYQGTCPPYLTWGGDELPIVLASYDEGLLLVAEFRTTEEYHRMVH